jgi:hypothetical protein
MDALTWTVEYWPHNGQLPWVVHSHGDAELAFAFATKEAAEFNLPRIEQAWLNREMFGAHTLH